MNFPLPLAPKIPNIELAGISKDICRNTHRLSNFFRDIFKE